MSLEEAIGALAAVLTTLAFVPQALKVMWSRQTEAISLSMYVLFTTGVVLWGVYGLLTWQWPIIIANGVTLVLAAIILGMKIAAILSPGGSGGTEQGP